MNLQFPPNSRYSDVPTTTMDGPDGEPIVYLTRRFVPPPEAFALLQLHIVKQGDRLDNVTAQYLDDPEQFWRVADANRALDPGDLTATPGRALRITLPLGVPGMPNA